MDGLGAQARQARAVQRAAAAEPAGWGRARRRRGARGRRANPGAGGAPETGAAADAAAAFSDIVGDRSILGSIKYVITLDTDTQLPRDAAHTLIGNMAHPLNRPVFDAKKGRVVDGYGILQPRASISLASSTSSRFTRLFAGEAGIDPYTREISDVYQDLFGEGSFVGKGIYDVAAFAQAVSGRFPENLILSHDLLESGYARSALVADVDLIEEHPTTYPMEASRRHRWTRGDWQLAGWLLPRVPGAGGKRQREPAVPPLHLQVLGQPAPQPRAGRPRRHVRGRMGVRPRARVAVAASDCRSAVPASSGHRVARTRAQTRRAGVAAAREPHREIRWSIRCYGRCSG